MTRHNVDQTRRALEQHPMTNQLHVDGDSQEAIFRAIIETEQLEDGFELPDGFREWVEELPGIEIVRNKWLGFAREVTFR